MTELIEAHETELAKRDQKVNQLTIEKENLKSSLRDRNDEIRELTSNFS